MTCNMCNAPKYGRVEQRTGFGGGYMERDEVVEYNKREDSDDEYDEFGRKKKKFRRSKSDSGASEGSKVREPAVVNDEDDDDDEDEDVSKYKLDSDDQSKRDIPLIHNSLTPPVSPPAVFVHNKRRRRMEMCPNTNSTVRVKRTRRMRQLLLPTIKNPPPGHRLQGRQAPAPPVPALVLSPGLNRGQGQRNPGQGLAVGVPTHGVGGGQGRAVEKDSLGQGLVIGHRKEGTQLPLDHGQGLAQQAHTQAPNGRGADARNYKLAYPRLMWHGQARRNGT